jgi:hypothetical protein
MSTFDRPSDSNSVENDFDVTLSPSANIYDVGSPSDTTIKERTIGREATAANLGKVIVWTFTGSVAVCFLVVLVEIIFQFLHPSEHELTLTASFELFKTVSAIMSDPLGFVLGFYFRDGSKS